MRGFPVLGDVAWALAFTVVGVAAVVAFSAVYAKTRSMKLEIKKVEAEIRHTQATRDLEITQSQMRDSELARDAAQRDFELSQTPEGKTLKLAQMALEAAEKRQKAAEAEAKAKYADGVAKQAAEDDKIAHRAQMQALIKAADEWARSHPQIEFPNPFDSMNLDKSYAKYCDTCEELGYQPKTLNEWIGDSLQRVMIAIVSTFKA